MTDFSFHNRTEDRAERVSITRTSSIHLTNDDGRDVVSWRGEGAHWIRTEQKTDWKPEKVERTYAISSARVTLVWDGDIWDRSIIVSAHRLTKDLRPAGNVHTVGINVDEGTANYASLPAFIREFIEAHPTPPSRIVLAEYPEGAVPGTV